MQQVAPGENSNWKEKTDAEIVEQSHRFLIPQGWHGLAFFCKDECQKETRVKFILAKSS